MKKKKFGRAFKAMFLAVMVAVMLCVSAFAGSVSRTLTPKSPNQTVNVYSGWNRKVTIYAGAYSINAVIPGTGTTYLGGQWTRTFRLPARNTWYTITLKRLYTNTTANVTW